MSRRVFPVPVFVLLCVLALLAVPWQAAAEMPLPARSAPATSGVLADPAEWPTYGHDLQRTNFNPAETLLSASNVNQLVERWRANLGGPALTSGAPSVANGKVFVGSSITTGDNFFAFDAVTGSPSWSANIGHGGNCFGVGVGATSAISGSVLSVGGGDRAYYGLNADSGAQLWRESVQVLGNDMNFPWASPLLANGRSYIGIASCADNPSARGEVRAIDMVSGANLGNQYFVPEGQRGAGIWNSPALSPDGSILVVATGEDYGGYNGPYNRALVSLDAITMQILQSNQQGTTGGDRDYATTPLFFSDSQGRTLVGGLHKNSFFYAYEVNSINSGPIWSRSLPTYSAGAMPAYDPTIGPGGTLFVLNTAGVRALDPETGADRYPLISASGLHGNIALANGLMFLNVAGTLQIRDASNGALLRAIVPTSTGGTYTGPVVSNGFVYWLSGPWLNAWSLPADVTPTATPVTTPTFTATPVLPTATSVPTDTPTTLPTLQPTETAPPQPSDTPASTPTYTASPGVTIDPTPSTQPTLTPVGTAPPTLTPGSTPTVVSCTLQFEDVPPGSTFYPFIRCLACQEILNGYPCGGPGYPCVPPGNMPYFLVGNQVTRGQLSKIVANSAGFNEPISGQTFEDVPPSSTFYAYIERLASRAIIRGYNCGAPGEPCVAPDNRWYFRPYNSATRGQISKIVSEAAGLDQIPTGQTFEDVPTNAVFWLWIERLSSIGSIQGYPCGGLGEPCIAPNNRPYFRPDANTTRGQVSKIVSNTFFPTCNP